MSDEPIENRQPVGPDDQLVMIRREMTRNRPCMLQLVEIRLVEPDR